jgi:lipoate-protein ligase A
MRLYVPGREVAFGRRDTVTPEYPLAVAAARDAGFAAVERLAGGRAAVFTEHTIAFALAVPDRDPRTAIYPRFQEMSDLIVASFRRLGIMAGIGEVSGEYCPGEYSVHHKNRIKLMGMGQRLTKHAAHVGGVIAVSHTKLLLSALIPVYRALDIEWRPATTGSLADINAGIGNDDVIAALKAELSARFEVARGRITDDLVVEARRLAGQYLPDDLD